MSEDGLADEPSDSASAPVMQPCRSCRHPMDVELWRCPMCGARGLATATQTAVSEIATPEFDRALVSLCIWYGVMMGMSVLYGILASSGLFEETGRTLILMCTFDAAFLGAALIVWWKTRALPVPDDRKCSRWLGWLLLIPMLMIALGGNLGYHYLFKHLSGLTADDDYVTMVGSLTAAILVICVEPALVEEFFFRGVAWKSLRQFMGPHATVLVSSVMFGMAHIGVPLSVPALFGVGIVLGYLRWWSGGLILPMILHFLHNLVIVLYPDL